MSITPEFKSGCELANGMPDLVAEFLEIEKFVGRPFREESISDIIVASIVKLPGENVVVLVPQEPVTGGDFDIIIVDPETKESVQYRIQAKRLTPHKTKWMFSSYRELAHPHNTGKQASTLIRSSAHEAMPTIPLYAFYNPGSVCKASDALVSGLELADAKQINEIIKTLVKAKPKRPPLKRLQALQPLFFPLSTLLCANSHSLSGEPPLVPAPSASRLAVERAIADRETNLQSAALIQIGAPLPRQLGAPVGPDELITYAASGDTKLDLAGASTDRKRQLPEIVERAIERRRDVRFLQARVARPRVILISDAPQ